MGVCVTNKFSAQLKGTSVTPYPILGENTSPSDYNEAEFVMYNGPCTAQELEKFRMSHDEGEDCRSIPRQKDVEPLDKNACDQFGVISEEAQQMKEGVAQSQKSDNDNSTHLLTDSERDEWYKRHMDQVKEVLNDDRFSKSNMQNLEQSWNNVMLDEYANVNKCHGKKRRK